MLTLRRQILPAITLTVVFVLLCCVAYPAITWVIGDVAFHSRITGSMIKENGHPVGSSLIGQNFLDASGNPLPQYFQPRPSDTYTSSYNPAGGSSASNLGPENPLLVGFIPGINAVQRDGSTFALGVKHYNPFATAADPFCVPMSVATSSAPSAPVASPSAGEKFAMSGGSFTCDPNTVPERAIAYRSFNHLSAHAVIPVDAVTASASGLDPDITPANAALQLSRVASVRHLPTAVVQRLVARNTAGRNLGFLGEETVNVVTLNLALDKAASAS